MKKLIWAAMILAVVGAGAYFVVRGRGSGDEPKYRTETADRGDVTMAVTATGTISAVTSVQVGSQVSGIIARLHADFNSKVRKGQLLAELDPTPFEARVAQQRADVLQAEVQMRRAKLDFDRQQRLLEAGLSPQSEFDAAKATFEASQAQVDQASAALRQALTDLQYTKILSPIDGVVVARQYDVGQTVAASFQAPTLFTIAQDLTKMQVQADVDQSDIGRVKEGQSARFTVDAYPDEQFRATIAQIRLNASVNQNVITYPVILSVPNPDGKLRPQMTADVSIEVAQVEDVLRVPNAALRFRPTDGSAETRGADAAPAVAAGAEMPAGAGRPGGGEGGGGGHRRGSRDSGGQAADGHGAGSFRGAAQALDAATAPPASAGRPQAIYVLDAGGTLRRVPVRTGISDGKYTQIVSGELQPGERVVTGQVTAKLGNVQLPPGAAGGGGGGRGRGF
jgi:HlyD family secretion protein